VPPRRFNAQTRTSNYSGHSAACASVRPHGAKFGLLPATESAKCKRAHKGRDPVWSAPKPAALDHETVCGSAQPRTVECSAAGPKRAMKRTPALSGQTSPPPCPRPSGLRPAPHNERTDDGDSAQRRNMRRCTTRQLALRHATSTRDPGGTQRCAMLQHCSYPRSRHEHRRSMRRGTTGQGQSGACASLTLLSSAPSVSSFIRSFLFSMSVSVFDTCATSSGSARLHAVCLYVVRSRGCIWSVCHYRYPYCHYRYPCCHYRGCLWSVCMLSICILSICMAPSSPHSSPLWALNLKPATSAPAW
jgi:hypothetical protein